MGEPTGSSPRKCSPRFQPRLETPAVLETASVKLEGRFPSIEGGGESRPQQKQTSGQRAAPERPDHNAPAPREQTNKDEQLPPLALLRCRGPILSPPLSLEGPGRPALHPPRGRGHSPQPPPSCSQHQGPEGSAWYKTFVNGLHANTIFCQASRGAYYHRLCPVGGPDLLPSPWETLADKHLSSHLPESQPQ